MPTPITRNLSTTPKTRAAERPGSLDTSFGQSGQVHLPQECYGADHCQMGALNTLFMFRSDNDYGLTRLDSAGHIDSSFGKNGVVLDGFSEISELQSLADNVYTVGRDQKKIMVTGSVYNSRNRKFYPAAARYDDIGQPDLSFNRSGKLIVDAIDLLESQTSDDSAGTKEASNFTAPTSTPGIGPLYRSINHTVIFHFYRFGSEDEPGVSYLVSLNLNGFLNRYFNRLGFLKLTHGNAPLKLSALSQQPDGKIIYAGRSSTDEGPTVIGRLHMNGTPDRRFGNNGIYVLDDPAANIHALMLVPADSITPGALAIGKLDQQLMLLKLTSKGTPDRKFGNGKPVLHRLKDLDVTPLAMAIDSRQHIVVTGRCFPSDDKRHPVLIRFLSTGELDRTFGTEGVVIVDGHQGDYRSVSVEHADNLLVGGEVLHDETVAYNPIMARYLGHRPLQ
ncbi:hypothetical protein IMF27_06490 [Pseudomonas sp. PCH199]|uniref:hypothetical protein n=1 Tax=unclassified Pseudomonas TaxID=196821 RepID=UPI000BDBECFF|nr:MULTISPECIES: hypothetical protein [unclassified Pseudomonas]MCW8275390.1 hypothetical protein [Pseudomonas sp. PCH199]PAM84266.1 hypothetical protein CES87_06690 [Pseudomonas sp. ERMR1:02]